MKKMNNLKLGFLFIWGAFTFAGCGVGSDKFDATGTFETDEVIVSAEAAGSLIKFDVDEGYILKQDQIVGYVDTMQLYLKKKQLQASIKSLLSKRPDIASQLATIQEQINTAQSEKERFEKLVKSNAATQKQLDDINNQIELLNKQYKATQTSLKITAEGLEGDTYPLAAQIEQLEDQISKSIIKNPINGTVITKYAKQSEITANGKALYKIGNLDTLILRVYVSGNQLVKIKLGQNVKVFSDDGNGGFRETSGQIYWISAKSEFTPKTIQTKDERANLVYAVKIRVRNDGFLKIGMYGEIKI
jgi:HlyD family secretion protein